MTRRRARWDEVLLRVLPGTSPMHRMWAGTKLVGVAVVTVGWLLFPGWGAAAAAVLLVVVSMAAGGVPFSVLPRPAWWVVALFVLGGVTAAFGGQLVGYLQAFIITLGVLALGAVVTWTTPLAEVADALQSLGAPLRRIGLPAGEWAAACAVGVRSLPMLLEEWRVLVSVHRLRTAAGPQGSWRDRIRAASDLPIRALIATLRRAGEVGLAVAARGGPPDPHPRRVRLHRVDTVAIAAVLGGVLLAATLPA